MASDLFSAQLFAYPQKQDMMNFLSFDPTHMQAFPADASLFDQLMVAEPQTINPSLCDDDSDLSKASDPKASAAKRTSSLSPRQSAPTLNPSNAAAERRATHNAIERARRESLNGRFLELASALPAMAHVKRPSKSVIVNKSLEYIFDSQVREQALMKENQELRRMLNEYRRQAGHPPLLASTIPENESKTSGQAPLPSTATFNLQHTNYVGTSPINSETGSPKTAQASVDQNGTFTSPFSVAMNGTTPPSSFDAIATYTKSTSMVDGMSSPESDGGNSASEADTNGARPISMNGATGLARNGSQSSHLGSSMGSLSHSTTASMESTPSSNGPSTPPSGLVLPFQQRQFPLGFPFGSVSLPVGYNVPMSMASGSTGMTIQVPASVAGAWAQAAQANPNSFVPMHTTMASNAFGVYA